MAAEALTFEIVVPYSVELSPGVQIDATALVKGFGARMGMLIVTDFSQVRSQLAALDAAGFGFSVLDAPASTDPFNIEEYAEMLRDWGWAGDEEDRPSWY